MFGRQMASKIDSILTNQSYQNGLLRILEGKLNTMANELENLRAAVAQTESVEQSSLLLIQGMSERMKALASASPSGVDPAAIQALADELMTSSKPLAAAVTENTPTAAAA